jgi:hypothetical protein
VLWSGREWGTDRLQNSCTPLRSSNPGGFKTPGHPASSTFRPAPHSSKFCCYINLKWVSLQRGVFDYSLTAPTWAHGFPLHAFPSDIYPVSFKLPFPQSCPESPNSKKAQAPSRQLEQWRGNPEERGASMQETQCEGSAHGSATSQTERKRQQKLSSVEALVPSRRNLQSANNSGLQNHRQFVSFAGDESECKSTQ